MSPVHLLRYSIFTVSLLTFVPCATAKSVRDDGVENPPLLEIQRSGVQAVKPLARLKKTVAPGQLAGPQEAYLTWRVAYTESTLWNPATGRDDRVRLRSYQGTHVNPDAPFVAPMIRVAPGDTIRATLSNQLPADPSCYDHEQPANKPHCFNGTNMHTHGLWINPAGNSDNVLISINPGVDFQYEYNIPLDHPAGTFWYHPHRHGSTALQVGSGMAGALIIDGKRVPTTTAQGDIDTLLQPTPAQLFKERVLLFQQIQYACYTKGDNPVVKKNADGTYRCDPDDVGVVESYANFSGKAWGQSGRYTSINGEIQPGFYDAKAGQVERWRMIHGGVRDSINLQFRRMKTDVSIPQQFTAEQHEDFITKNCNGEQIPQHIIAADGLTTATLRATDSLVFQPGYRWDSLMLFPEAGQYCVIDAAAAASANVDQTPSSRKLLGIVHVAASKDSDASIQQQLQVALIEAAKEHYSPEVARLVVDDLKKNRLTKFVPHKDLPPTPNKQTLFFNMTSTDFLIDDEIYKPGVINRTLILGNIDEWTLTSKSGSHPYHIHVNPFQVIAVLDPNGKDVSGPDAVDDFDTSGAPDPQYRGMKGTFKDTVWVKNVGGKTYRVIVRTHYQRYIGDFVLHCHILDHEDQGMMQNVRIALPDGRGGAAAGHH